VSGTLFLEYDLLQLYHVYVLKRAHDKVLVEYGVTTAADCEMFVMRDTQTCLMFWQGAATHHLRKFNVRDQPPMSPCPTQAYQQHAPPCAFAPAMYARTKVIFS